MKMQGRQQEEKDLADPYLLQLKMVCYHALNYVTIKYSGNVFLSVTGCLGMMLYEVRH